MRSHLVAVLAAFIVLVSCGRAEPGDSAETRAFDSPPGPAATSTDAADRPAAQRSGHCPHRLTDGALTTETIAFRTVPKAAHAYPGKERIEAIRRRNGHAVVTVTGIPHTTFARYWPYRANDSWHYERFEVCLTREAARSRQ